MRIHMPIVIEIEGRFWRSRNRKRDPRTGYWVGRTLLVKRHL